MDTMKSFFSILRWVEAATLLLLTLRAAPSATRNLVNSVRIALSVLNSPCFLFLLGNAIVLLLFFKYRNLNNDDNITVNFEFLPPPPVLLPKAEEEKKNKKKSKEVEEEGVVFEDKEVIMHRDRTYRRSKSERMETPQQQQKSLPNKLKRSKTEMVSEEDGPDEFRRTIEAFIEKQLKFQREESMSSADMLAIVSTVVRDEEKEKE